MQELIKIKENKINKTEVQTVNARELHGFLEVGKDFSNWIKDRISKYKFQENQDFIVIANSGENLSGGRPYKDYHITIGMAKELSMVERNDRGSQARKYFIDVEGKYKSIISCSQYNIPKTYGEALKLAYEQQLEIEQKDTLLLEQKPKVEAYNTFIESDTAFTIKDFANTAFEKLKLGRNKMFKTLRDRGYLTKSNLPYQRYLSNSTFKVIKKIDCNKRAYSQTLVTPKGMDYLLRKLNG